MAMGFYILSMYDKILHFTLHFVNVWQNPPQIKKKEILGVIKKGDNEGKSFKWINFYLKDS